MLRVSRVSILAGRCIKEDAGTVRARGGTFFPTKNIGSRMAYWTME